METCRRIRRGDPQGEHTGIVAAIRQFLAIDFLAIGSMQNAERFLVRGLERFPGDPEMTKLLGQVRQFSDRGAGRGSDTGGAKTRSDTGGDDDERSGAPH